MKKVLLWSALPLVLVGAAIIFVMRMPGKTTTVAAPTEIRYVPLGDSYTIGTGASEAESWPAVLTAQLQAAGFHIQLVANPAHDGWDSQQALDGEIPIYENSQPNFATVLIGGNDIAHRIGADAFRQHFSSLLDKVVAPLPNKRMVLVLTIPDFSRTPVGRDIGIPGIDQTAENTIKDFNAIIRSEATKRKLTIVDLYPLSQVLAGIQADTAADGLHPSAAGYQTWVNKLIFPAAHNLLSAR